MLENVSKGYHKSIKFKCVPYWRRTKLTYPSLILAVLFRARHAVSAAKGMALAS